MKADMKAIIINNINMNFRSPNLQSFPNDSEIDSISLQRFNEALITNIAAIVMGASFENTLITCATVGQLSLILSPEKTNINPSNVKAVTSTLTFSKRNETRVQSNRPKTNIVSQSINQLWFTCLI
jgi:hypothetical protein